ncbi:hypothetical protein LPW26_15490 [Rhodopseudomonas sp. HC1]|uniref:hypothetical protein n=1 Tax=Rhodopseudomonas infernalis TaxID=2897386 RepID=UPI001EE8A033|nr:hypothetical protein [Rhodopseudomonas infernalis]MCG6206053.1 hypothetical protein [Rhodopseudomonas infernalis]
MAQGNTQNSKESYRPEPDAAASRFDSDLQADPELREGRIGTGRIVMFAAVIALLFGAVFYGMNSTAVDPKSAPVATTVPDTPLSPAAQEAQAKQGSPAASDTAPRPNPSPGVTTGAAPSPAQTPATTSQPSDNAIR